MDLENTIESISDPLEEQKKKYESECSNKYLNILDEIKNGSLWSPVGVGSLFFLFVHTI